MCFYFFLLTSDTKINVTKQRTAVRAFLFLLFNFFFTLCALQELEIIRFLTEALGYKILLQRSFVLKLQNSCWLRKPRLRWPIFQGNCCLLKYCSKQENVIKWQYFEHLMISGISGHFRTWNMKESLECHMLHLGKVKDHLSVKCTVSKVKIWRNHPGTQRSTYYKTGKNK